MQSITDNLALIHRRMSEAAVRAGRDPGSVRLVAVSKTHPAEAVIDATAAGQRVFGESRVQEARDKIPACPAGLEWHFIGHLQKNKVRQALPLFSLLHSIDSLQLAQAVDRIAGETSKKAAVLLEINIAGETTKHGFTPDELRKEFAGLSKLRGIRISGLMTMAPYSDDPEDARPVFRALRKLRDGLQQEHGVSLPELSMGMSGDFEPAIEEGSTLVRVGTAIFGSRPTAPL